MNFKTPYCPECGELADGVLDDVPGVALLSFDEHAGKAGSNPGP